MAENNEPIGGGKVDPSEDTGPNASASAQDRGAGEQKKDKPGDEAPKTASKGINPVQHSE
jgi:hypothetical protein